MQADTLPHAGGYTATCRRIHSTWMHGKCFWIRGQCFLTHMVDKQIMRNGRRAMILKIEYLGEFEVMFETDLAYESEE